MLALLPVVRNCAASPDEPGAEKACRANPEAELWMRLARDGVSVLFLSAGLVELGGLLEGSSLLWLLPRFLSSVMIRVVVWGRGLERDGKDCETGGTECCLSELEFLGGSRERGMSSRRDGRSCMVCR